MFFGKIIYRIVVIDWYFILKVVVFKSFVCCWIGEKLIYRCEKFVYMCDLFINKIDIDWKELGWNIKIVNIWYYIFWGLIIE